ncbi:hypothetical protein [Bradyrhizobium liaoningense]|uniref:hypothetical protein n=1 Tax=Bradyrhizobium liaoningense TaxID=43992 RepID=UPI001BA572FD|nr:hypothetical protein [Bradyrhizobium liaoningense]MBR0821478.1 hypothetical protein [Bradyrhizobium liaoningense]
MAESEQNRERFHVAYVGDDENDHSMDLEALGPALLAFGQLLRAANAELNQNRATMKVLVDSKFEHKCFLINFETERGTGPLRSLMITTGQQATCTGMPA